MKKTVASSFIIGIAVVATIAAADSFAASQKNEPKAKPRSADQSVIAGPKFSSSAGVSSVKGAQIFVEYCAVCHGMQGKGDGPRSAFFSDTQYIPDLTVEGFVAGRDKEVLDGIREGLRRYDEPAIVMPQFKYILSENDIQSAYAYVKTLSAPQKRK